MTNPLAEAIATKAQQSSYLASWLRELEQQQQRWQRKKVLRLMHNFHFNMHRRAKKAYYFNELIVVIRRSILSPSLFVCRL